MDGDTGKRKDDYAHGMAQDRRQVTNHLVHAARAQTRAHCIRDRPRSDDVALAHAAQATHPHSRRCAVVCHSGPEDRARRAGRGQTRRHDRQAGHAPFFLRPVGGAVVVSHVCTAAIGGGACQDTFGTTMSPYYARRGTEVGPLRAGGVCR